MVTMVLPATDVQHPRSHLGRHLCKTPQSMQGAAQTARQHVQGPHGLQTLLMGQYRTVLQALFPVHVLSVALHA